MSQQRPDLLRYRDPFRFALYLTKKYKLFAIGCFIAVLSAKVLKSSMHYVLGRFTDSLKQFSTGDALQGEIWFFLLLFVGIHLSQHIVWRASGFFGMRWFTGIEADSYTNLFSYLTRHSREYFSKRFAGTLTSKVTNAGDGLVNLMAMCTWQFLPFIVGIFTNLTVAYTADSKICLFLGIWIFLFILVNFLLVKYTYKYNYEYAKVGTDLQGKMVDSTSNIAEVHHGGHYSFEKKYVGEYISSHRTAHLKTWFVTECCLVCNGVLNISSGFLIIAYAIYMFLNSQLTIGSVLMVVVLVRSVQQEVFFLGVNAINAIRHYSKIAEGLEEILIPHDVKDSLDAHSLELQNGEIEFRDVTFSYSEEGEGDDSEKIFENFDIKIPAGQKLGFVGVSGAGKSTFVSLLLRQYDINSGEILIDGQNIKDVTQKSLRRKIALVPQETTLFHRSIRENIRYGDLRADDKGIEEASKMALADKFIKDMPKGYDTYVGERGVKLSGGQRQRVAIARAFLKNAPILVLDEATSALDSESEAAVQDALDQLFEGRTVIAIAHRLSTLRMMDRIVVIKDGQIIEDGTHTSLVEANGVYAGLWESQVSGFI